MWAYNGSLPGSLGDKARALPLTDPSCYPIHSIVRFELMTTKILDRSRILLLLATKPMHFFVRQ